MVSLNVHSASRVVMPLWGLALSACCTQAAPPSQFPTAGDAFDRMKATYACANGVQGEGEIDRVSPGGRIRGEAHIFAVNPARVRFDVISPFGAVIFTVTSNGELFQMLDTQQKQFLHGPASACNLARLTQVPMPGYVLASMLRGEASLLVHEPSQTTLRWECGHYVATVASRHDASQEIHLEVYEEDFAKPWREQKLRVTQITTRQQGRVLYTAEMSDHELAHTAPPRLDEDGIEPPIPPSGGRCDVEVPRSIRVQVPNTSEDVVFEYRKVAFNPPIPAGAFSQPVPGGVEKVFVTCD